MTLISALTTSPPVIRAAGTCQLLCCAGRARGKDACAQDPDLNWTYLVAWTTMPLSLQLPAVYRGRADAPEAFSCPQCPLLKQLGPSLDVSLYASDPPTLTCVERVCNMTQHPYTLHTAPVKTCWGVSVRGVSTGNIGVGAVGTTPSLTFLLWQNGVFGLRVRPPGRLPVLGLLCANQLTSCTQVEQQGCPPC